MTGYNEFHERQPSPIANYVQATIIAFVVVTMAITQIKKGRTVAMGTSDQKAKPVSYVEPETFSVAADPVVKYMSKPELEKMLERTKNAMKKAAKELDFIEAARLRDEMYQDEKMLGSRK